MFTPKQSFYRPTTKLSVLFVAASPRGTTHIDFGREHQAIDDAIQRSTNPERFVLHQLLAATRTSIQRQLSERVYDIVHISASVASAGLYLSGEQGASALVSFDSLAKLLARHAAPEGSLRCVLFNTTNSFSLGHADTLPVPYTIVMEGREHSQDDDASIGFVRGFYDALTKGRSIEHAYDEGRVAAELIEPEFRSTLSCRAKVGMADEPELTAELPHIEVESEREPPRLEPPTPGPKLLHGLQREIYEYFDEIQLSSVAQLSTLDERERRVISRKLLPKLAGIGRPPNELLDQTHVNLRFEAKQLSGLADSFSAAVDVLNRKTAIYAEHAIICIDSISMHQRDFSTGKAQLLFDDATIALLLEHRKLIEAGRMSIVPRTVMDIRDGARCVFNAEKIGAIPANLSDPELYTFLVERGEILTPGSGPAKINRFNRAGVLKFNTPSSEGMPIERIFEIEQLHSDAYELLQSHLRAAMGNLNGEVSTEALKQALRNIDESMRDLDAKYAAHRRKQAVVREQLLQRSMMAGVLAIGLYAADTELTRFIGGALAGSQLSNLITFFPAGQSIPDDVRDSPYFIAWKIRQEARGGW